MVPSPSKNTQNIPFFCPDEGPPQGDPNRGRARERAVLMAALLTGSFMIIEVVGGIISGSLALIADAAHMLTDTFSLTIAWWAFWLTRQPADPSLSFGRYRLPVLVAFGNALVLILLSLWIFVEAIKRIMNPPEILTGTLFVVACAGLLANIAAFWVLHRSDRDNLNMRSAILHVLSDLLGSFAAIAAAVIIYLTGYVVADPILSTLVGFLILRSSWFVLRDAAHILLQGAPKQYDILKIIEDLRTQFPDVKNLHHVHLWSLDEERIHMTGVVVFSPSSSQKNHANVIRQIKKRVQERFCITHATLEMEVSDGE